MASHETDIPEAVETVTVEIPTGDDATGCNTGAKSGGAPAGNANAMTSGRYGLVMGRLPKGCSYIRAVCSTLRRELEESVVSSHGEIDLASAATIATACRFERHALLCSRWLRECLTLDAEKQIAFSREVANASERRDKAIRSLGLKAKKDADPWEGVALLRSVATVTQHAASPQTQVASDGPAVTQQPADAPQAIVGDSPNSHH